FSTRSALGRANPRCHCLRRCPMQPEPTPADIEAGAQALAISAHSSLTPTSRDRDIAQAMLRAVLPDHDARVRADERARVAEQIPGWAHGHDVTRHGDALECCWCGGL